MPKQQQTIIHYPHRNGPICGNLDKRGRLKPTPTDARSYSVNLDEVTCEECQEYMEGVGGPLHTAGLAPSRVETPTPREIADEQARLLKAT